jgi:hypothetical protein
MGEFKGILQQSLRVHSRCYLKGFHNSRIDFMLNSRKFSFYVFTNDCNIDIVMAIIDGREGVAKIDIGKKV